MGADNIFLINSFLFLAAQVITATFTYNAKKLDKVEGLCHFIVGVCLEIAFIFNLYLHAYFTGSGNDIFLKISTMVFFFNFVIFLLSIAIVVRKSFTGGSLDV